MKRIINGKRYDTTTAKAIGKWESTEPKNSFKYYEETLYRKITGEYFIHGKGNANSPYAQRIAYNTWGEGERILRIKYENAKKWAEENLAPEEFEREFGERTEQNEKKIYFGIAMTKETYIKIKKEAYKNEESISKYIERKMKNEEK